MHGSRGPVTVGLCLSGLWSLRGGKGVGRNGQRVEETGPLETVRGSEGVRTSEPLGTAERSKVVWGSRRFLSSKEETSDGLSTRIGRKGVLG